MQNTSLARITTGKNLFLERIDGRTLQARRFREVYQGLLFAIGGKDELNMAQRQLARRAATLCIEAEFMETAQAKGEAIDTEKFCRVSNTLSRLFVRLGVNVDGGARMHLDLPMVQWLIKQLQYWEIHGEFMSGEDATKDAALKEKAKPLDQLVKEAIDETIQQWRVDHPE